VLGFWLGLTACVESDVGLSANIDADVFIQFVQPVLEWEPNRRQGRTGKGNRVVS